MKKIDLLTEPVGKTILRFSIPTIIGMAATQLYSVVDTMIIGQLMDKYALDAAVGLLVLGGGMWGWSGSCGSSTHRRKFWMPRRFMGASICWDCRF